MASPQHFWPCLTRPSGFPSPFTPTTSYHFFPLCAPILVRFHFLSRGIAEKSKIILGLRENSSLALRYGARHIATYSVLPAKRALRLAARLPGPSANVF